MTVLEGRNLYKSYSGGKQRVEALAGVSIALGEGEILGVAGESGSGKSTLLKLLSGLDAPESGEIFLNGKQLGRRRSKQDYRCVQMIFQDAAASFHPRMTMGASIETSVRSLLGPSAKVDMDDLMAQVGLDAGLLKRYPRNLSGGQCQRMAIARALVVQPRIFLCDEITSALDGSSQAQILRLLVEICRKKGMSAVFVSHDLAVISCICDRVLVLKNGKEVEQGAVRSVIENPQQEYTRQLISSALQIQG